MLATLFSYDLTFLMITKKKIILPKEINSKIGSALQKKLSSIQSQYNMHQLKLAGKYGISVFIIIFNSISAL
jgi:hypothetical protein